MPSSSVRLTPISKACYTFSAITGIKTGNERRRPSVKLENFCYSVAMKTLELLEREHHYKIPDKVRKEIADAVIEQMDSLIES